MRYFFLALLGLMLALASFRPIIGSLRRYHFRNPLQAGGFSILLQTSTKLLAQNYRYNSDTSTMTAEASAACANAVMAAESGIKTSLPELSTADFRLYNRLADMMEYYVCWLYLSVVPVGWSGG